jgi:hypothetical protein
VAEIRSVEREGLYNSRQEDEMRTVLRCAETSNWGLDAVYEKQENSRRNNFEENFILR